MLGRTVISQPRAAGIPRFRVGSPDSPGPVAVAPVAVNELDLAWPAAPGATSYQVDRSADGLTGWTLIGTSGPPAYADIGGPLAAATTWFYRVRGVNAFGVGPTSRVGTGTTLSGIVSPAMDFSDANNSMYLPLIGR